MPGFKDLVGGGFVGAARTRLRGAFDGVRSTVDTAIDQDVATAAVDGVRGFFKKNGDFRREITR